VDNRNEIRDFLVSRRGRITPEQAGLAAYGRNRRVPGLRREEAALLAGISIKYYTRLERGNASGVSEDVLEGIVRALRLDDAERAHLFDLVRAANTTRAPRRRPPQDRVRPMVQRILDAMSDVPAYVRNGRLDILSANRLGTALYPEVFADPVRPANMARFIFLNPQAGDFFADWQGIANDAVAILRAEAGRDPYDRRPPILSVSCRPAARTSGSAGRPTTSSSAAPTSRRCTTRSSVTSPSPTSRSTFPTIRGSASSSTPPSPDRSHRRRSTSSPAGPPPRTWQSRPSVSTALKAHQLGSVPCWLSLPWGKVLP
jgi:transcriptional regulator with XRE-family HTH domain